MYWHYYKHNKFNNQNIPIGNSNIPDDKRNFVADHLYLDDTIFCTQREIGYFVRRKWQQYREWKRITKIGEIHYSNNSKI